MIVVSGGSARVVDAVRGVLGWRPPLMVVLVAVFAGAALAIGPELTAEESTVHRGPYGYLLLQLAAWLGLQRHGGGAAWTWAARGIAALFVVNLILFLAIDLGVLGPQIVVIAFDLVLLFVSGGLAILGLLVLGLSAIGRPRPPVVAIVAAAVIAAIVNFAVAAIDPPRDGPTPPPTLTATASPTPTPTPTARPERSFQLVVKVEGKGSVLVRPGDLTCRVTCTFPVREGTIASLTAQPEPDTILARWAGCRTPCQVRMDQAREIQATFRLPTLIVTRDGKGSGSVRSEPAGIACPPTCVAPFGRGVRVTLTPTPDRGAAFTGWSQACRTLGACELQVASDSEATAHFEALASRPGYEAKSCTDAGRIELRRDQTRTLSACFVNAGGATWTRGAETEVELGQCCPLGGPSPLSEWGVRWPSDRVYADLSTDVAPGQQGQALFQIRVPANATFGDHRLDGILIHARSGAPIAGGAFSIVVTVVR